MINIKKGKFIQRFLTILATVVSIFLTSLVYFGGWTIELNTIIIFLLFLIGEITFYILLYYLLRMFNKSFFQISINSISLYKNNSVLFVIETNDIIEMRYTRVFWALISQIGAGYLEIYFDKQGKISQYPIAMSLKEAKEVASLLNKRILIK